MLVAVLVGTNLSCYAMIVLELRDAFDASQLELSWIMSFLFVTGIVVGEASFLHWISVRGSTG